jgi:GNAT superfamily N-acetyltransferase
VIRTQRRNMFVEMKKPDNDEMRLMAERFVPWVEARIADGSYVGWLVEDDGRVVAGAGLWVMEFPPHWMDSQTKRAYLLNFYVNPEARGKGLAFGLLKTALAEVKELGVKVVVLHASAAGRPLYERNGFEASNEMMLRL